MKKIILGNFGFSLLVNLILFGIVLFLFHPAYNADVDIYFLYTLSGGYGNAPSPLLHIPWEIHPVLALPLAGLFRVFPGLNWYTVLLVIFHLVACTTLFLSFLYAFNRKLAVSAFVLFFLFIESRLLLGFDCSGTALVLNICGAGSFLLYAVKDGKDGKPDRKRKLFFYSLIFLGGLIRFHYMIFFCGLALLIGFFFLGFQKFTGFLKIIGALALLLLVFFLGQRLYYKKMIPDWTKEEQIRNAHYFYSNRPHKNLSEKADEREAVKQDLISISFLYDQKLTDYVSLKKFSEESTRGLDVGPADFLALFWLFMESRVYIIPVIVISLLLLPVRAALLRFLLLALAFTAVLLFFCLFIKLTLVIYLAIVTAIFLSGFLSLIHLSFSRLSMLTSLIFFIAGCSWMLIRLNKISRNNSKEIATARSIVKELNSHPDILFVDAGSFFDFHFSIWDVPAKYPMRNFVYNELFFANSYRAQFARFGVSDLIREIPERNDIYLTGEGATRLIRYYRSIHGRQVQVRLVPGFQFIRAYQVFPALHH